MERRPDDSRGPMPGAAAARVLLLVVPLALLPYVVRAEEPAPATDDPAVRLAALFERFDVAPRDGVLVGAEMESLVDYDTDRDGRVTPTEFVAGYAVRKPAPRWRRHEFRRQGFSCEMPGEPQPLDSAGPSSFQVAADAIEPPVLLVARVRDMPTRAAGKPALLFDSVVELLEQTEAEIIDRRAADLGLHPGGAVTARRADGSVQMVRSVVIRRTVYELDAFIAPGAGAEGEAVARRFLDSLDLTR